MEFACGQDHFCFSRRKNDGPESTLSFPRDDFYSRFGDQGHFLSIEQLLQFRKLVQGMGLVKDAPPLSYPLYSPEPEGRGAENSKMKESDKVERGDQSEPSDSEDEIDVENSPPSSPAEFETKARVERKVSIITRDYEKSANRNNELPRSRYLFNPLPIRKKSKKKHVPAEAKDHNYWRQRVKNNIAARKSREDRRRKEIEVVMQCENLLLENYKLRHENGLLQARMKVMEAFVHSKMDDKF